MFKKLIIITMLIFASVPMVYAQDEGSSEDEDILAYGESVTGEITNRDFEVEYSFQGEAGDIVLIQVVPDDSFDELSQPAVLLLDEEFNTLVAVDAWLSSAILVHQLDSTGTYFILASRQDGRSGETVGNYTLFLDRLETIEPGNVVNGTASTDTPAFFAISSSLNADVVYTRVSGELEPEITLNYIDEDGGLSDDNLNSIAQLSGSSLQRGAIGIPNISGVYIVKVQSGLTFFDEEVSFTLEVVNR